MRVVILSSDARTLAGISFSLIWTDMSLDRLFVVPIVTVVVIVVFVVVIVVVFVVIVIVDDVTTMWSVSGRRN